MAAALYKNYLRLCEKWRVDPSKKGRDLGEFIRQQVCKEFSQGEASNINNLKDCERKFQSLNRLANNYYGKQIIRNKTETASGLTREECREVLSTETLEYLTTKNLSFFDKLKLKFSR